MKILQKIFSVFFLSFIIMFYGCNIQEPYAVKEYNETSKTDDGSLSKRGSLNPETFRQLQQVKSATAKYHNIEHAFADGYEDINVVVPNMGRHYLKAEYLNGEFEVDKPEILVYSPHPVTGKMRLVAVEYAVPLSPDPPEGFTGDDDVWGVYEGVLWTLHAWVWEYNPDGVFNPTNPNVP